MPCRIEWHFLKWCKEMSPGKAISQTTCGDDERDSSPHVEHSQGFYKTTLQGLIGITLSHLKERLELQGSFGATARSTIRGVASHTVESRSRRHS
mmetsp:Transcript_2042/g.5658  ORF Transcript_2042/g.5658 Transcript_2042/m.5658 type:complete len:95 (+) Transcript_2042:801-1085(+)